ncbi:hypothetical protein PUN28_020328 [Cardiocondyla obscurior]|uniref:Uncharacterized protein n=1 Tax=Cardiocondyla obscurior TaxID=286306 RepID=A0AAW2E6P1_9HYME
MEMESDKEKDLQFQSDRTLRSRRGGYCPALSSSSSYDGRPPLLRRGGGEHTPAKIEEKERQLPRIISNELVKPKSRRPGPKCAKAKKKANNFAYPPECRLAASSGGSGYKFSGVGSPDQALRCPSQVQGRPVVTGEGIEIQAIRAKKVLQKLNEEIRTAKEILESAYDPADFKSKKRTAMAQRLEEEMANLPPRDIVAQPADSINSKDSSESQEEIQRLRAEVSALRNELQTLRQQTKTGQEPPVVQQNMEVEMMDNGESITFSVLSAQREKWPPGIRPALRRAPYTRGRKRECRGENCHTNCDLDKGH